MMVEIKIGHNNLLNCDMEIITFWKGKYCQRIDMYISQFNGSYVGAVDVNLNSCGMGAYPSRHAVPFPTREACLEHHARQIREYIKRCSDDSLAHTALKEFNKNYADYTEPSLFT